MPPRRQPATLKTIALRAVSGTVAYQVRVVMSSGQRHSRRLHWLHNSVNTLPDRLREPVVSTALHCADVFLGYRNNHPARRVLDKLLVALLPKNTRRLALPVAESYPVREAMLERIKALAHLHELTLSETLHQHTNIHMVVPGLQGLRQLRVVRAPWLCSDAIAAALAESCPLLTVVDAAQSSALTDSGVFALARGCPQLRVLLLTECRVSLRGYKVALSSLRALQRVGRCPSLGCVLRAAGSDRSSFGGPSSPPAAAPTCFALTEWDSDHAPDPTEAALCPSVRSVLLSDVILVPSVDESATLSLPPAVERLCVGWVGDRDHASRLSLRLTSALKHLDLTGHDSVTLADAMELGRQCPDLRVLKLTSLNAEPLQDAPAYPVEAITKGPFRKLEEFHLYSGPGPLLEFVLVHGTALRRVSVTPGLRPEAAVWTDSVMHRIVAANPLNMLESFIMAVSCALTVETVFLLMHSCPRLRTLLDISDWALSETQMNELREVIAVNNWDLELGLARL